ncbi:copper resistance protein [Escherichia coli]|uniref:copper resistance protein n=1 Tax=Escherichia coli TaxID=562 RepID=UPI00030C0D9F
MAKQHQMGWLFLCLACVVFIVCTAQHIVGMHVLQRNTAVSTQALVEKVQSNGDDISLVSPCELSSRSLLSAPLSIFDGAILLVCLLLALLSPVRILCLTFSLPRGVSPPAFRIHLRFCVFRE